MKNLPLLIFLFFKLGLSFGQTTTLDSLKLELTKTKSDTTKVLLYEKLMRASQGQASIDYGMKGLALAKRIHFDKGIILCGNVVAFITVERNYYKSILMLMETKQLCEKTKDSFQLVNALAYLGYAFGRFDQQKALQYDFQCKALMEKLNITQSVIPINTAIGYTYKDNGFPDSALVYLQKGYAYALQSDKPLSPQSFDVHFGEVYYQKGQKELAMSYFLRSIAAIGEAFPPNGQNDGQAYLGMARIYRDRNELDSARYCAKKALQIFQERKLNLYVIQDANLLFELYKNSNTTEALHYLVIASTTKDSLFSQEKGRQIEKLAFEEREQAAKNERMILDREIAFKNRVRLYALLAVLGVVLLIAFILYRNNRQKQVANKLLQNQKEAIQSTLNLLKSTQAQLIQSEKLASLGELTAGIAHEIQNPLNFVNNFSELSVELLEEMESDFKAGKSHDAFEIAADLKQNLTKINHHGKRASAIVKGMLEHSRTGDAMHRVSTDLNALADEYLRLAYHGLRAKDSSFNATMETHFDPDLPKIEVIPQDIGRVLLNLINNAFYAVNQRNNAVETLHATSLTYQPTVIVSTKKLENAIEIRVKDNGNGIPEAIKDKIFQPFFTTKPTGQGTGLGLSLAYDIVTKGHGGKLEVESSIGAGTTFILTLPYSEI